MSRVEREFKRGNASGKQFRWYCLSILLLYSATKANAQWKQVLHVGTDTLECVTFLNPELGYVGTNSGVFRTTDGGNSWNLVPVPGVGVVSDFAFKDSTTGWLSIWLGWLYAEPDGPGCFETTNGGNSWFAMPGSNSAGSGIYYDSLTDGLFLSNWESSLPAPNSNIFASWDEGVSWQAAYYDVYMSQLNGFAFSNPKSGVLSSVYANWYRTRDGGKTWAPLPQVVDTQSWQPLAIPNTNTIFVVSDNYANIIRSTDFGDNWTTIFRFPSSDDIPDYGGGTGTNFRAFYSSGCIRGDSCRLFVQLGRGMYISTDQGYSWSFIGGAHSYSRADRRFYYGYNKLVVPFERAQGDDELWELDLDSIPLPLLGISSRLDNGTQQITLHPGDSVGVTFVPGAGTLAATDSVTLTLHYDPNAASLSSLVAGTGWRIADSSSTDSTLTLTLRGDSAESVPDPLLHAEFQTYLTPSESSAGSPNSTRTFIYLDSAHSFFPQSTPCAPTVLSLQQPDSVELDFTGCGDSILLAVMEHEPPFSIERIVPNPASTAIAVRVWGIGYRVCEAQLFDAIGNCVLSESLRYTPYPIPYTLDVSALPSGIYFLRLSSGSYTVSRSVAIER